MARMAISTAGSIARESLLGESDSTLGHFPSSPRSSSKARRNFAGKELSDDRVQSIGKGAQPGRNPGLNLRGTPRGSGRVLFRASWGDLVPEKMLVVVVVHVGYMGMAVPDCEDTSLLAPILGVQHLVLGPAEGLCHLTW